MAQLQIISQNYVVWNPKMWKIPKLKWVVANYITKLRGLKPISSDYAQINISQLQIISQNYVVWNFKNLLDKSQFAFLLQIISQNYVVWNRQIRHSIAPSPCVANYITKLRGLKPASNRRFITRYMLQIISQNYVVWNFYRISRNGHLRRCKLYHKTTWFETADAFVQALPKFALQIISQNYVVWNLH